MVELIRFTRKKKFFALIGGNLRMKSGFFVRQNEMKAGVESL